MKRYFFIFLCSKAATLKNHLLFIYIAFGLSFAVIITISLSLLQKFTSIIKSNSSVEHTYEVKNQLLKVQSDLIEAENSQQVFLLTEDTLLLKPLSKTQITIFEKIDSLRLLTKDNQEQQVLVKKLKETVSLRYQMLYATIDYASNGQLNLFLKYRERGNKIMQQFMKLSQQMDNVESNLLQKRRKQKSIVEVAAPKNLALILLVSCLFQAISFLVIIKDFKRRRIHQKILEQKINQLNVTNAELEQIAFVASHDLQEPLRKIRTFTDKLIIQYKGDLQEEGQIIVEKISSSSQRMQELLNDLLNYTHVTKNEEEVTLVDLQKCFDEVRQELDGVIQQKKATIKVEELPVVSGHFKQLFVLFYNLLDNSLKFSKPGVSPVINVIASKVSGEEINSSSFFTKITVSDNGMGFEKEFNKKVFVIFKRLHANNSFPAGKGIGLAICKKVMLNHNGFITAKGEAGIGATFNLYFPADSSK